MKNTKRCAACGSPEVIRAPGGARRYLANSICVTRALRVMRIPAS